MRLPAALNVSRARVQRELARLEKLGIIRQAAAAPNPASASSSRSSPSSSASLRLPAYEVLKWNNHIEEDHPLLAPLHFNGRLAAIERVQKRTRVPGDFHLTASFSTSPTQRLKIHELFLEFVREA